MERSFINNAFLNDNPQLVFSEAVVLHILKQGAVIWLHLYDEVLYENVSLAADEVKIATDVFF